LDRWRSHRVADIVFTKQGNRCRYSISKLQLYLLLFLSSVICHRRDGIDSSQDTVTSLHCPIFKRTRIKSNFKNPAKNFNSQEQTHLVLCRTFPPRKLKEKYQTSYSIKKKKGRNPITEWGSSNYFHMPYLLIFCLFVPIENILNIPHFSRKKGNSYLLVFAKLTATYFGLFSNF